MTRKLKGIRIMSRPWKPQDLIDDLQLLIDEEPDSYINDKRTTLCMARDFLKEHFAEPRWISVEDRLPEDLPENKGKRVIPCIVALKSCYPNGKATIQKRQRQVLYNYDFDMCGWEWSRIGKSRVTHWMPLPEPPEVEA